MKWCQACRSVVCRHSGMLFSCCHLRDKIGACQHAPMIAHSLVGVEPYLAIFKKTWGPVIVLGCSLTVIHWVLYS